MLIVKIIENNTMYSMQIDLHTLLCSNKVISAIFVSSIFSVHSSTNLSTNIFPHQQFSQSKYSLTSHDLSNSNSQLLGFQINHLLHTPLSINILRSRLHLSSFHLCLLLQALASRLHLHLQVSCHFMGLVSLVLDIRLNTLPFMFLITSGIFLHMDH